MNKDNYHITRTPDGIRSQSKPGKLMARETFLNFQYSLYAYSHLLAMNERISGQEYIARIKKAYNAENPRNARCISALAEGFEVTADSGGYTR